MKPRGLADAPRLRGLKGRRTRQSPSPAPFQGAMPGACDRVPGFHPGLGSGGPSGRLNDHTSLRSLRAQPNRKAL